MRILISKANKLKSSLFIHKLSVLIIAFIIGIFCLLSFPLQVFAVTPDNSWNLTSTTDALSSVADCTGDTNQTDMAFHPADKSCQNYNTNCPADPADLYESLDKDGDGFEDADISFYRVGQDANFFYFEIETVESYNFSGNGGGHNYVLEIDADLDGQPDFYYIYDSDPGDVSQTWISSGETAPINAFRDSSDVYGTPTLIVF